MALKITLAQDKDKGPGYGRLTISGLSSVNDLTLRFESNQINQEHLQLNGQWGTSPASHDCILLERNADYVVIGLEPSTIDAFLKNARATYRVIISYDGKEKVSPFRIPNNLLGSGAIQKEKPVVEVPETNAPAPPPPIDLPLEDTIQNREPEDAIESTDQDQPDTEKKKGSARSILLILLFLSAIGFGAGWYMCLIPGLPPGPTCKTTEDIEKKTADEDTEESTAAETSEESEETSTETVQNFYEEALALQKTGALIEAKAKFQKAATEEKHVEAMKRIAEMYDPTFWSKETSPIAEPNWETANWWWEMAGNTGDVDAQRHSGYNMAKYSSFKVEKDKGLSILKEMADQGDAKALELQRELNGE